MTLSAHDARQEPAFPPRSRQTPAKKCLSRTAPTIVPRGGPARKIPRQKPSRPGSIAAAPPPIAPAPRPEGRWSRDGIRRVRRNTASRSPLARLCLSLGLSSSKLPPSSRSNYPTHRFRDIRVISATSPGRRSFFERPRRRPRTVRWRARRRARSRGVARFCAARRRLRLRERPRPV